MNNFFGKFINNYLFFPFFLLNKNTFAKRIGICNSINKRKRESAHMLKLGEKVLHCSEKYEVVYIYDSGYVEIKKNPFSIKLVHVSEITPSGTC